MNVNEYLESSVDRTPNKNALFYNDTNYSFSTLNFASNRLANRLLRFGIKKGDRVLIVTGNCPETIISIFACSKISAIFVPISHSTKPSKLSTIIRSCKPASIIIDTSITEMDYDPNLKIIQRYEVKSLLSPDNATDVPSKQLIESIKPISEDIASIIYTSGSLGEPKGVTMTHHNMDVASGSIIKYLENVNDDIILNTLPLSFDYGLYQLLMTTRFGGTLVLENSFTFINKVLKDIEKYRVTGFPIVPALAEILLKRVDLQDYDLTSVRYISNTAQALTPAIIKGLQKAFKNAKIFSMYGLTECKRVSYLDPSKIEKKPGSVGRAIPDTEVFLLDEKRTRITEAGKIGELAVRGGHIMVGYWNDPVTTSRIIIQGAYLGDRILLTGDNFLFDEEGDLFFMGRRDETVKIGGEKAIPREVEMVVGSMEGITNVAVIPVPDDIMGNRLVCFICSKIKISEKQVKDYCSQRLEKYLVPIKVFFREKLPLTSNGKVDKKELFKEYCQSLGMDR